MKKLLTEQYFMLNTIMLDYMLFGNKSIIDTKEQANNIQKILNESEYKVPQIIWLNSLRTKYLKDQYLYKKKTDELSATN